MLRNVQLLACALSICCSNVHVELPVSVMNMVNSVGCCLIKHYARRKLKQHTKVPMLRKVINMSLVV